MGRSSQSTGQEDARGAWPQGAALLRSNLIKQIKACKWALLSDAEYTETRGALDAVMAAIEEVPTR